MSYLLWRFVYWLQLPSECRMEVYDWLNRGISFAIGIAVGAAFFKFSAKGAPDGR